VTKAFKICRKHSSRRTRNKLD